MKLGLAAAASTILMACLALAVVLTAGSRHKAPSRPFPQRQRSRPRVAGPGRREPRVERRDHYRSGHAPEPGAALDRRSSSPSRSPTPVWARSGSLPSLAAASGAGSSSPTTASGAACAGTGSTHAPSGSRSSPATAPPISRLASSSPSRTSRSSGRASWWGSTASSSAGSRERRGSSGS